MSARLISDYIASGLAAARPATPDVVAGTASYYYATDTGELSIFLGGTWYVATTGTSGGPAIVQQDIEYRAALSAGITLPAGPTQGNILISMQIAGSSGTQPGTAVGWTPIFSDTSAPDCNLCYRVVTGAAESATQVPTDKADYGVIAMWEVSDAMNPAPYPVIDASTTASTAYTVDPATDYGIVTGPCMLLGLASRRSTALPTSITGATVGPTASDAAGVSGAMFNGSLVKETVATIGVNYSASASTRIMYTLVS